MSKGYECVYMSMGRFYVELTDNKTDAEQAKYARDLAKSVLLGEKGVLKFADDLMDATDGFRAENARRQREYKERKLNGGKSPEDSKGDETSKQQEEHRDQPKQDNPKSNRRRPKHDDSDNPEKKPYGEAQNVFLTDSEYSNLLKRNGSSLERIIEKISSYKASNGKVYASDYSAIINWVEGEVKQEMAKADSTKTFRQRDREDQANDARAAFPEVMERFGL